eukprot:768634-Hanusia_phi.AAC.12
MSVRVKQEQEQRSCWHNGPKDEDRGEETEALQWAQIPRQRDFTMYPGVTSSCVSTRFKSQKKMQQKKKEMEIDKKKRALKKMLEEVPEPLGESMMLRQTRTMAIHLHLYLHPNISTHFPVLLYTIHPHPHPRPPPC